MNLAMTAAASLALLCGVAGSAAAAGGERVRAAAGSVDGELSLQGLILTVHGAETAQCRMAAPGIAEALDVVEPDGPGLISGSTDAAADAPVSSDENKSSMAALPQTSPSDAPASPQRAAAAVARDAPGRGATPAEMAPPPPRERRLCVAHVILD
jgi:hypothetical protein